MVIGGVANERAAKLQALHNAAEARGYNGAQAVAELTRVVVEQGRDWDRAYQQALSFYRAPAPSAVRVSEPDPALAALAAWWKRVVTAVTEVVAALAKAFGLLGGRRRRPARPWKLPHARLAKARRRRQRGRK